MPFVAADRSDGMHFCTRPVVACSHAMTGRGPTEESVGANTIATAVARRVVIHSGCIKDAPALHVGRLYDVLERLTSQQRSRLERLVRRRIVECIWRVHSDARAISLRFRRGT